MTPTDLLKLLKNDLEWMLDHNRLPVDAKELVRSNLKKIKKILK